MFYHDRGIVLIQKYAALRLLQKYTKIFQRVFGGYAELSFHHTRVGLLSLTHASMDSDNHPITLCLPCSQKPPKAYNVLRTFQCPSECISPAGVGFCCVVLSKAQLPNPLRVLSKTQPSLDDEYTCGRLNRLTDHYFGYGLLVIGYWLLAIGYWLEYAVYRYPCLSPLNSRL